MTRREVGLPLTPDLVLAAYRQGIFPMSEGRFDPEVFWVDPRRRGIIPLGGFHVSRSLARTIRRGRFRVTLDGDFAGVVAGCAGRPETWISDAIAGLYEALHARGDAHSVEAWAAGPSGDALAGGVYGVAIGGAFFAESMFSRRADASKVALAALVAVLRREGFRLLDTQFLTPHLASLGGVEVSRLDYRRRLAEAVAAPARFGGPVPGAEEMIGG